MPKETRAASREENLLATKLRRLKTNRAFSCAQIEKMPAFSSNAPQLADNSSGNQFGETSTKAAEEVMDALREKLLAQKIRRLRANREFSRVQIEEMASFSSNAP